MNTRLQVEHPVTELVCGGIDLVEHQLRVAAGEPLSIGEVAAERSRDRGAGLRRGLRSAASSRRPARRRMCAGRQGVRVDHALESGQVVSTAYDPMLGKVIAHGPDREAARQALVAALDDTAILGLTTNAGFLRTLVASDEFRDATIDTAWLDRHEVPPPDPAPARELAAWAVFLRDREEAAVRARTASGSVPTRHRWSSSSTNGSPSASSRRARPAAARAARPGRGRAPRASGSCSSGPT